ncbi:hypothetical protein [Gordonia sp. IITR100]|uniref:hypothetical protein n=1 Tax=Gordonia sp. IITR100 TaxID=1314686 RepID=UPI000991271E|nr:hypothetical protein [Gordonia sp. IITR100]
MNEHEQETRELEQGMERALAVAIAHTSALIEAWARRAANKARENTADTAPQAPNEVYTNLAADAADTQRQVRAELAVAQPNADYWKHASPDELARKIREDYGIEPARLGERTHDRHWAERADGRNVVDLYAMADRYAEQSATAAAVRDNIGDLIRDYGLDPVELMRSSPHEAAERYTQSRAEHWAPGQPPALSADGRDATDRDGVHVAALLTQAQAADLDAEQAAELSDLATERADAATTTEVGEQAGQSRADRVAAVSTSESGKAATTAARDHPTNPRRAAASTGQKQPTARRSSTLTADRQRGRGL